MLSSKVLRDIDVVSDVKMGAPKVTPKAYKVTVNPAVVTRYADPWRLEAAAPH